MTVVKPYSKIASPYLKTRCIYVCNARVKPISRHSGATQSVEPGISRFRVCAKRRIPE
jgi:hypothetical protein